MPGKKVKPLRHSTKGGYARGDETRQRIVDAALDVFGEQGFDAATTRQIAMRAGVNTPALQYYFENKEGLYLACAESLVDESQPHFQPLLEQIQKLDSQAGIDECTELFCQLMETMLDRIFGAQHSLNKRLFHARIQLGQGPERAFTLMREKLGRGLHDAGAKLIAHVSQTSPEDEQTQLRVLALFGQVAMLHIMRRSVLDQLNWQEVDKKKLASLKVMTREQCTTLLRSWRPNNH